MSSTKTTISELRLSAYWELPRSPKIEDLRDRLALALQEDLSPRIVLSPPLDWDRLAVKVRGASLDDFAEALQRDFGRDLSAIRCFFDAKMLRTLGREWLVQGHRIYFLQKEPSYSLVSQAVAELLMRQPLWEK